MPDLKTMLGVVILMSALSAPAAPKDETILLTTQSDLEFGTIIATTGGGTVTITPNGQRVFSGVYAMGGDTFGPARFQVEISGKNPHYQIIFPTTSTLSGPSGASMVADTFTSLPTSPAMVQTPDRTGQLDVGATLHINPQQRAGTYLGVFDIIVQFGN